MCGCDLFITHNIFSTIGWKVADCSCKTFSALQSHLITYFFWWCYSSYHNISKCINGLLYLTLYENIHFNIHNYFYLHFNKSTFLTRDTINSPKCLFVISMTPVIYSSLTCVTLFLSIDQCMVHCFPLIILFELHLS